MVSPTAHKFRPRFKRTEEPICIGGIFSLTGYLSWLGIYKKKASELKVELINSFGGIEGRLLKLATYDDCSSAEQAAKAAEALIYKHKAIALVGTGSLPVSLAVARIANNNKIPAFLNSGYAIDPVKDLFVFNTAHKTEFALACAFKYFSERDILRIALLMPHGPLGDVGSWFAKYLAEPFNIKIVCEERFDLTIFDIKGQLERIKGIKPQAVFSFVTGRPAAWVAKGMANMGFNVPLLISHGNATPSFLKMIASIGTIAHEVGYQDQCYFTKVFKRYTGVTPKEYRKSPVKYIPSKWSDSLFTSIKD